MANWGPQPRPVEAYNPLAPFDEYQLGWIHRAWAADTWLNFAEGGVRAGKNVMISACWGAIIDDHPDKLHLAAGFSISTARLNIIDCNGYGLENYFAGRCRWGEYQGKTALIVQSNTGTKYIIVAGGGKKGDERLIRGNTYGTVCITEANKCTIDFLQECLNRTVSSSWRKIFMDCNPEDPNHPFYKDFMDLHAWKQKRNPAYGFNYGCFTLANNQSLSNTKIKKVLETYDPSSVWYKRDILAKRAVASGAIFQQVANHPEKYICASFKYRMPAALSFGMDFGGNKSKTTIVCSGFYGKFKGIFILKDLKLDDSDQTLDANIIAEAAAAMVVGAMATYPNVPVLGLYCDNENQTLVKHIRNYFKTHGIQCPVRDCNKATILDRIWFKERMLNRGRYVFDKSAVNVIKSTCSQIWDAKHPDTRLDNGTVDIDTADAEEYSWSSFMKYFIQ